MHPARIQHERRGGIRNLLIDGESASSPLGDTFTFWFRPNPVSEAIRVAYEEIVVIGMSHAYRGYAYTNNITWSFELYANRIMLLGDQVIQPVAGDAVATWVKVADYIEQGRRFMQALAFPPARPGNLPGIGDSPPACLLVLPGIASMRCRVINIDVTYEEVDARGLLQELRMRLSIEAAPLGRITMQDILERGMFQTWGGR